MGQGLKQRLLGVVVLLGLLVLLAPALFRGADTHPLVRTASQVQMLQPEQPAYLEKLDVAPEVIDVTDKDDAQGQILDEPGLENGGYLKAWSLQLATFSDQENASRLELKLKNDGYSAYTRQYELQRGGQVYKVYVGPEARQTDLLNLKQVLDKQYDISSLLVKFIP